MRTRDQTFLQGTPETAAARARPVPRRAFLRGALFAGMSAVTLDAMADCSGTSTTSTAEQVVRYGVANPKVTLDVQKTTQGVGIAEAVCETLVYMDESVSIQPLLLEQRPTISADGLTYDFELKGGVKFHDGTTLTAEDVRYSFERMFTPATKAQSTSGYDNIVGAKEMLAGTATELAGFSVADDTHFTLTLAQAYSTMLAMLTEFYAVIYPKKACEEAGDDWGSGTALVGSGPFRLASNDDSTEVVLERFDDYHEGAVSLDRIDVKYIDDANTKMMNYKTDDIDLCDLDTSLLAQYQADDDVKDQIVMYTPAATQFVNVNLTNEDVQDVRVRQALSLAINRQEVCDTILGGAATPASQFAAPGEEGHDDSLQVFDYDPDMARQLLAEAGREDLSLVAKVRSQDQKVMVAIQDYWRNVGVSCDVQVIDSGVWSDARANGELMITTVTWTTMCYVGAEHIRSFFYSTRAAKKSSFYDNPDFDALLDKAQAEVDQDRRIEYTREADAMLCREDYATIPVCWPSTPYVSKKSISGLYRVVDFRFTDCKVSS